MTMPKFPIGDKTTAAGPDPNQTFDFRYRVVSLDSLEASHDAALAPNPDFPAELQPRIRIGSESMNERQPNPDRKPRPNPDGKPHPRRD